MIGWHLELGSGAGTLSLYQYEYPEKRVKVDSEGNKTGVPGKVHQLQQQQVENIINQVLWRFISSSIFPVLTKLEAWNFMSIPRK